MGYRSTFVTDDQDITLPQWFIDRWADSVFIRTDHKLPIASKQEMKVYFFWEELPRHLQLVLNQQLLYPEQSICLMFLHEDGLHTRFRIFKDLIEEEHGGTAWD